MIELKCCLPCSLPGYTAGDGVADNFDGVVDNCQTVPNNDQADSNSDGQGDACDPVVTSITAPIEPVNFNDQPVHISGTFVDPDDDNYHTAEWDWGDNTTSAGTVNQTGNSVSDSHVYNQPGVYRLKLMVTDGYPASDDEIYEFVVIYDSDSGFVTGGGWILSPINDDYFYMDVEGKANFGFVSKYKKDATVPTGNTEFNFSAGGLNFHSDTYGFLVINQGTTNAPYKGSGTINGEGEYPFMLWAGDKEPESFHIKIWWEDESGEHVVYDNGHDQEIGGGNIVVHTTNSNNQPVSRLMAQRKEETYKKKGFSTIGFQQPSVRSVRNRAPITNIKESIPCQKKTRPL